MSTMHLLLRQLRTAANSLTVLLPLALSVTWAQESAPRIWTDSEGRQIRASIEGFQDENTIIFKLDNGSSVPYQIAKLSSGDIDLARKAFADQSSSTNIDWENPKQSENYVIKSVRRQNVPGYISTKSGWEWQLKSIEAKVEYKGQEEVGKGEVKAYFYDRDGRLIDKVNQPPRRQNEDRAYVNAPTSFEEGETIETYFPLTEFFEESGWSTVLIAFGYGDEYSVDTMPRTSLKDLDFDEKRYVFPSWKPSVEEKSEPGSMSNVSLEVRRVRVGKHKDAMTFDGDYRDGMPCVSAEVRATGEITPGSGEVRMHVFNEEGRLVDTRRSPSSAQIDGSGTYVENPRIADESWHPVFFALDQGLEEKNHPTYVCVFEFGGKISAEVQSSVGATLDSLDFPEKSKMAGNE